MSNMGSKEHKVCDNLIASNGGWEAKVNLQSNVHLHFLHLLDKFTVKSSMHSCCMLHFFTYSGQTHQILEVWVDSRWIQMDSGWNPALPPCTRTRGVELSKIRIKQNPFSPHKQWLVAMSGGCCCDWWWPWPSPHIHIAPSPPLCVCVAHPPPPPCPCKSHLW